MITGEFEGGKMAGAAASQPPSAEEEALKRNTDCVYFLASPLTCKKGSDCEYRHSDFARVNPRDCWFWLNGNCLNPNCGFRHPPLDGLLGTKMPTSNGSAQPLPQTVTAPPVQVVDAYSKQGMPCKFFQSGCCLNGDWCLFLHIPNSMKNKAPPVPVTASATEPLKLSKSETSILGKMVLPTNNGKPIKGSPDQQIAAGELKPGVHLNEVSRIKMISNTSCINELPDYNSHHPSNGDMVNQFINVQLPQQDDDPGMIDDNNVGDVSREPSPGFDVLVDDEGRDSDFYDSEVHYGLPMTYEADEYGIDHLTDYDMVGDADDDRYCYLHGYDSHQYPKGQYGSERNRVSSDRMSAGPHLERRMSAGPHLERRPYARAELDLRDHLTRNKQPRGLRYVISHEQAHDKHANDHNHEGLQRHERYAPRRENFFSSRLQGRIRLPRRSASPIDREMIRRSDNGRFYSARECHPSNQRLIQDRMKGRVEGASVNGWKNDKGLHPRRDMAGDGNDDFAGPKTLSELKNRKNAERHHPVMDQQQLGKRKYAVPDTLTQYGSLVSFEGPRPLEEILKRKRGETTGTGSHGNSSAGEVAFEDNNVKEGKYGSKNESVSPIAKKEANFFGSNERNGAGESYNDSQRVSSKVKGEGGTVAESWVDGEFEVYEEMEEFNPKVDGATEFDMYGGEEEYLDGNGDGHGEANEFAKKLGVVY